MSLSSSDTLAGLPETLAAWVATQRWYGGKGGTPHLERIGGWSMDAGGVRLRTHYLLDRGESHSTLYQVPLTERENPLPDLEPMGVVDGVHFYDAPHDPAYPPALVELILSENVGEGVRGHRQPGASEVTVESSAVLTGEQSNTSIICSVAEGTPLIVKVFRALHHGDNPDVVLQSAINATRSDLVPHSMGSISGDWPDSGQPDGVATGHLAFAQEFLPGSEDAWRVALRAAENGEDFSQSAYTLGQATADVHAALAKALPTQEAGDEDVAKILKSMRGRLDLATQEVPSLAGVRPLLEAVFDAAGSAPWPRLQRIHGDFHLGQVLSVPDRGWVLVDFEGEPLRSMVERSEPDVTLRDVAGMLRSFDYAAGSLTLDGAAAPDAEWAPSARQAFVNGYVERSAVDIRAHRELLDAFEIDKALYEIVYEARNRPAWIGIPEAAIFRLAQQSDEKAGSSTKEVG